MSSPPDPFALVAKLKHRGPAPVHLWDPPFCGDIDLVIKRDGTWVHEGRPIKRMAMVQLFASVLKREQDAYFLVTPVEKIGIQVEDCPFIVTETDCVMQEGQQILHFTTNVGETVVADSEHPINVMLRPDGDEPRPTLLIRSGLEGLLSRAAFYRLVELAEPAPKDDPGAANTIGVSSAGVYFPLGEVP